MLSAYTSAMSYFFDVVWCASGVKKPLGRFLPNVAIAAKGYDSDSKYGSNSVGIMGSKLHTQ